MNKAKDKVAAKVGRAKEKIAKKCGGKSGAKVAKCAVMATFLSVMAAGCGSNPAAYSVTQNNEFTHCAFNFGSTNACTNVPPVEMFTLAQNLENGGSQTADQAVRTDVSPEVAVGVGGSSAGVGSSGASRQGIGAAIGSAADAVASVFASAAAAPEPAKTQPTTGAASPRNADCPDGNCSEGVCSDGSCSDPE